jgi:6-pyruvoyl-tetrahydropterin synthase
LQLQRARFGLSHAHSTPCCAVHGHSFVASILPRGPERSNQSFARTKEHLIGRLPIERGVRHNLIVGSYVEFDQAMKSPESIQRVQEQP